MIMAKLLIIIDGDCNFPFLRKMQHRIPLFTDIKFSLQSFQCRYKILVEIELKLYWCFCLASKIVNFIVVADRYDRVLRAFTMECCRTSRRIDQ